MEKRVGIPQGLLFFDYYPLWKEFFSELGAEIVLSNKTNKDILNKGVSTCVDEACLPVKVFHGHVCDLKDKVDYLFIPKFVSIYKKEFTCPKFLGLPEMVKNSIKDLPPIIDIQIDLRKSKTNIVKSIVKVGKFFTPNLIKIASSYNRAFKYHEKYLKLLNQGVIPMDALRMYNSSIMNKAKIEDNKPKIVVLGHSYNLYDEHISMNLIKKISNKNINVITPEMIDSSKAREYSLQLPKRMFWSFGSKIIGSAFAMMEEIEVDGIIYVSSFGCGIDSVLLDIIERKARQKRIPFTLLTLDEHTGEAGVNTRIEAFIDMIKWREKNEGHLPTLG